MISFDPQVFFCRVHKASSAWTTREQCRPPPRPAAIEATLDKIVHDRGVFVKWTKRQHKTKPWLPLASYYVFYKSLYVKDEDAFVMLDAQLTRSPYATRRAPVVCGELYKCAVTAEVPLAASIIGDKLLTLGPETLGIPGGKKEGIAAAEARLFAVPTLCSSSDGAVVGSII